MDFQQAEQKFKQLKALFEAEKISETEFKTQLEELMVQDEQDNWWMIGYETEMWYRHDGTNWIQTDPPGNLPQKPKSIVPTEPKEMESKSSEKAAREKAEREVAEKAAKEKTERERVEIDAKVETEGEFAEEAEYEKKARIGNEPASKKSRPSCWKAIGFHLLFGFGLFYADNDIKRKWVYPIVIFYAIIDVFFASQNISPFIDDFGYLTFLASLGIYVLSFIDVIIICRNRRRIIE